MIIEQIMVTGMAVFCYLIADEKTKEGLLIDPAGDFDRIFKMVKKHNVKIKWVVNTHGHFDHTSGNNEVIKSTGAQLLIHEADAKLLGSFKNKIMSKAVGGKGSPKPMKTLNDGDIIEVGSVKLKVIHTPGHTEGGICLYTKGHIFTGDTLFNCGVGRTDLIGGSHSEILNSIHAKLMALPEDTEVYPGHGPKTTIGNERRMNPFLHGG